MSLPSGSSARSSDAPTQVQITDDRPWPALLIRDEGEWVSFHSRRDPMRDAARQLDAVDAWSASVLFVIGLGLGYLLDVLEERHWSGTVVVLEPDAALANLHLKRRGLPDWAASGRLTVVTGPGYEGLDRLMPSLEPNRAELVVVVNPTLSRLRSAAVEEARRRAADVWFGARANQDARRQNAGRYLLNTLRNAQVVTREADAAALAGCFPGVPAILVAAGPSLDGNIADIARYRDRALVVAVDTALRPLLAAGVQPDLVVAVDPTEANARHLAELPACPRTHFVTEGSVDPAAMPAFTGRIFAFRVTSHHPWPWLEAHGCTRVKLRAWGSVLTTAFDLALTMGCNPIVFTGADLAFTDERPYARGTTYEEEWARERAWGQSLRESWALRLQAWPNLQEPGVGGRPVRTAPHLRSFRDWIASEAAKATDRQVVNATPGGILVGPAIAERPLPSVFEGRPPLASPPAEQIATAYRQSAHGTGPTAPPDAPPVESWAHATQLTTEEISAAVATAWSCRAVGDIEARVSGGVSDAPDDGLEMWFAPTGVMPADPAESEDLGPYPGLSAGDREYLQTLIAREHADVLAVTSPDDDVLGRLRERSMGRPRQPLAIVDALGTSVGAQVRRAVDAWLCERADVTLEYRRFVDRDSRLSVLRTVTPADAPDPSEADAEKWHDVHRAVVDRLGPILTAIVPARSVIDLGCGAGFWLDAYARHGAVRLRGVTPLRRDDDRWGGAVVPADAIESAPLGEMPATSERFDVALCLEVAQRLPPSRQDALVAACTRLSDVVVFSSRPPGAPGGGPLDRPLRYWAEKFWRHGFVLDATIREHLERRWSQALSVYDGLVVFRRTSVGPAPGDARLGGPLLDAVSELYEQWWQKVWWSFEASSRATEPPPPPEYPRPLLVPWRIPTVRLAAVPDGGRVFRFRTDAARWYVTHPAAALTVLEDGRPMAAGSAPGGPPAGGGWSRWRDEITIRTHDGTDPRSNGRSYALTLPSDIAWLESQPIGTAVANRDRKSERR